MPVLFIALTSLLMPCSIYASKDTPPYAVNDHAGYGPSDTEPEFSDGEATEDEDTEPSQGNRFPRWASTHETNSPQEHRTSVARTTPTTLRRRNAERDLSVPRFPGRATPLMRYPRRWNMLLAETVA